MNFDRITVMGAGAWGTALANTMARAGRGVTLWARDATTAAQIDARRESLRLPGVRLDDRVRLTAAIEEAASNEAILLAVPAQALRSVATALAARVAPRTPIVACAKGIERTTRKFMTEVIAECIAHSTPAILSGPSFASDVARGLPTAVTLASAENVAEPLGRALGSATFRLYHSTDVRGVEIGGAAKNVLAIAAGIVHGRGLGASAGAALTTRGFAELFRFGQALAARPETLVGLSGLGDLILSCSTPQSRNFSLGIAIGKGRSVEEACAQSQLAEGVSTAGVLVALADAHGIEMPIARAVASVLEKRAKVDEAIESLLTRPFRAES